MQSGPNKTVRREEATVKNEVFKATVKRVTCNFWQREKQQEQSKKKNAIQSYLALIFRATIHHILLSYSILLLFAAKFLLPVFK